MIHFAIFTKKVSFHICVILEIISGLLKKIYNLDSYFDTLVSEREGHSGRRELNEHDHVI